MTEFNVFLYTGLRFIMFPSKPNVALSRTIHVLEKEQRIAWAAVAYAWRIFDSCLAILVR